MNTEPGPRVLAVSRDGGHHFSKPVVDEIRLVVGRGVAGDAHFGETVQHRSRVARDPAAPNLRQVHLLPAEFLDTLAVAGYDVHPGDLGENLTTRDLDLLGLPRDARLHIGETVIRVTGLRNPCRQIQTFRDGLLAHAVRRAADGSMQRLAGVMGVVERGGVITRGMPIAVVEPPGPAYSLEPV